MPQRIPKAVFIVTTGEDEIAALRTGQIACRIAYQMGFLPIFPPLFYMGFMTAEEITKSLAKESLSWLRRASRIWLCYNGDENGNEAYNDDLTLKPLAHKILIENEGLLNGCYRSFRDPTRLPVYQVAWREDEDMPRVEPMSRQEIASILRCNIVGGLLHGVEL